MKTIKLFAVLCCALVCAFTFSSCKKDKSFTYTTMIFNAGGSNSTFAADMEALNQYLESKGLAEGTKFVITDATVEKCDEQAKIKFENMVKNLSREELAEKVSAGFYFTYGCSRPIDASKPSETVNVASWEYPAK